MEIQIKMGGQSDLMEALSSGDKVLTQMLSPIKAYLETNAPKNKTQERLLDLIRELLAEQKTSETENNPREDVLTSE